MSTHNIQLTLAIIKPHVVKVPTALKNIRDVILSNGFLILDTKHVYMTREEAELFYKEHKNKFFYNRLVTLMTSGASHMHILAQENAIKRWRELMGPTKVFKALFSHPSSIRGMHGLSDTRNAVHGSDSPESAAREIKYFFPQFDSSEWNITPTLFNSDTLIFNEEKFVHQMPCQSAQKQS